MEKALVHCGPMIHIVFYDALHSIELVLQTLLRAVPRDAEFRSILDHPTRVKTIPVAIATRNG